MHHPEKPRPMRRPETEITARPQLEDILSRVRVLFLCLRDAQAPYVVPVCFGWEKDTLYVHSALSGTKIDLLRADPAVGFSACTEMTLTPGSPACNFGLEAESIMGTGRARILTDEKERVRGLNLIMRHYAESADAPVSGVPAERERPSGRARTRAFTYAAGSLARTCVIAIAIETLRGRQLGRRRRRTGAPEAPARSLPYRSTCPGSTRSTSTPYANTRSASTLYGSTRSRSTS